MTIELTEKDKKTLKGEKRIGYVFSGMILCFGGLFNLYYFISNKPIQDYLIISLINLGIIIFAYVVYNRLNFKVNLDLKENKKELLKKKIEEKTEEKSYEAGSGALYIPILGDLFPKLWGQKMRETRKFFIFTNDAKYEVNEDIYNELEKGSDCYMHFAKHSETILDFSKTE